MIKKLTKISALCLLLGPMAANADLIDFTDGTGNNLTSFAHTVDGATATFTNPLVELDTATNDFFVSALEGLVLGSGGLTYSFDVLFDQTVNFLGWEGDMIINSYPFSITGAGVSSSHTFSQTDFTFTTPLVFLADETYTFYTGARCCDGSGTPGGIGFTSWEIEASRVPEPATLTLFGLGLAGIGFSRRRKA